MSRAASVGTSDGPVQSARSRGRARRQLLLEVTFELLAREGLDAVSHRRVAELAGVPLGSTTYYFSSRGDMLVQALDHFARLEITALRERFATVPPRDKLVDELVAFLMPQVGEARWRTVGQYTLFGEASRRPELAEIARAWSEEWWAILARVFSKLDADDPVLEARMFLAMLDGFLLVQLAAPVAAFEERILRPALESWLERIDAGSSNGGSTPAEPVRSRQAP